ncbi:putative type III effector protein [Xanthomonas translucens pv. poae]|uniref:Putative type III effector protein n=1 Tax=Xanthomonas graminis pv. poae TaxID=227946 RepID=A0A0K3A2D7_9XANT|nr:type III secretion system leucine-rich repeat domain-containing effector XopL [Xanthomonas translucens]UKE60736.1 leucine-rich repeat domain-containing protein [Xanthomonas translucens pv. poae]CTP89680.1 putative type III effector protein [Xanthomonas translucens pv. poae]
MPRVNRARAPETPAEIPQHAESSTSAVSRTSAAPGERTPPLGATQPSSGLLSGLFRRLPGQRARHPSTRLRRSEAPSQQPTPDALHHPDGSGGPVAIDGGSVAPLQAHPFAPPGASERARLQAAAALSPRILATPAPAQALQRQPLLQRSEPIRSYADVLSQWREQCEADSSLWLDAWSAIGDPEDGLEFNPSPHNSLIQTANTLEHATSPNVTSLEIVYLPLPWFPEQTFRFSHLQQMEINWTGLMQLPESIGELTNLRKLTLRDNPIRVLPASISRLEQLRELSVISCPDLSELPEDLAVRNASGQREGLVNLQKLELSNTGIRSLPPSLRRLKELKEIKIANSPLAELDSSIHGLPKLEQLDLSGCTELREYPLISQARAPLKKLILRDCSNLRSLPNDIYKLSKLQELDLRGCENLRILPVSISRLPADCTIRVPPRLHDQLSRIRSFRSAPFSARAATGASSSVATSSSSETQQKAHERIDDTACALLDLVMEEERNPFVADAPFFIPEKRAPGTPITLGQVPSIDMMLRESKNPYFLRKLKGMADSFLERALVSGGAEQASDFLQAAANDCKVLKNSHLGIVDHNKNDIFRHDSDINAFNLSKAVQMWKSREMLVLEDPRDREHFPEIALHIPDAAHQAHQDSGND